MSNRFAEGRRECEMRRADKNGGERDAKRRIGIGGGERMYALFAGPNTRV